MTSLTTSQPLVPYLLSINQGAGPLVPHPKLFKMYILFLGQPFPKVLAQAPYTPTLSGCWCISRPCGITWFCCKSPGHVLLVTSELYTWCPTQLPQVAGRSGALQSHLHSHVRTLSHNGNCLPFSAESKPSPAKDHLLLAHNTSAGGGTLG